MSLRIEDYALIGDCQTAALVGRDGSIDWLCAPRFDSAAFFASLLGDAGNGRWRIAPERVAGIVEVEATRSYDDHTLILETFFETPTGKVTVIDFMPPRPDGALHVVRIVEGREGSVAMRSEMAVRFNYGRTTPWVVQLPDGTNGIRAIAGPDMLTLRTSVPLRGEDMQTIAQFDVKAGDRIAFVLTHTASHLPLPAPLDAEAALKDTAAFWEKWGERPLDAGPYTDIVKRSLMVLKALTYLPTGGIVAAPTTSLPEKIGGVRNWDYRYCWLRDADDDAVRADERRLLRGSARLADVARARRSPATPRRLQHHVRPRRRATRLEEWERRPRSPGYEHSQPVRVGNAAVKPAAARRLRPGDGRRSTTRDSAASTTTATIWPFQLQDARVRSTTIWQRAGPEHLGDRAAVPQQFTFSKIIGVDAAYRPRRSGRPKSFKLEATARSSGVRWPTADPRRGLREELRRRPRNAFVQSLRFERARCQPAADAGHAASCRTTDPRVIGTVSRDRARARSSTGFVLRYRTVEGTRRPAGRRRRVPRVQLLARRQPADAGTDRRGHGACSNACWRSRTTSDCSPRNTIRNREAPARQLPAGVLARGDDQLGARR